MMQDMQPQYAAGPQTTHQDDGGCEYYGGKNIFADKEDTVLNIEKIGDMAVAAGVPVI